MGVTTALRRAYREAGLSERELGRRIGYSQQMVSAVIRGGRAMAPNCALAAADLLDDAELYMALAEEATGAVMVPVVLDGPAVDLHRLATGRKLVEEAGEAIEALAKFDGLTNCRTAAELSPTDRERARTMLHHIIELVTCGANTVRVVCRDYEFSPREIYREHVAELVAKGYALPRREARQSARKAS